ncbi:MAG TPA: tRNA lysidine(34) synthetase TilS [Bacilli bacterium]|nr:tRNA lysidine(34) synthetase TilS [Bacilli bacterium]
MIINYSFDTNATYLVACSYGPDSMALLHLLMQKTAKIVVCHVNYHKRNISDFEEESLRAYCLEHNLGFEKFDAPKTATGNFQSWARELRYQFFADMYEKHRASALFVAHQQDDLIETYLIQKQRNSRVNYYGIEPVILMKNMTIVRPLLSFSKQDLLDYCHENRVPFSIDMSNFETKYLRNKIRLQVVARLTEIERYQILKEINENNDMLLAQKSEVAKKVKAKKELSIKSLLELSEKDFARAIDQFLKNRRIFVPISASQIAEIRKACQSQTPNIEIKLSNEISLFKEYDVLSLSGANQASYSFTLEKPGSLETDYFALDFSHGAEDRNVHDEDYPLTIRTYKPGDKYEVGGHLCAVRRLFIDWKMPTRLRATWPLVVNKGGTIIYVPRYRRDFAGDKKTKFEIKVV